MTRNWQGWICAGLLAAFFACGAAGSARAQAEAKDKSASDVARITRCLTTLDRKNPDQEVYGSCLMTVAKPCITTTHANPGTHAEIDCLDREREAWDAIVNTSYKAMMAALDDEQKDKLRDMQRSWIQTRDLTCHFWYDYFQGTMANPMIAYCNNRETARRAIFLRIFAGDIATRKN